MPKHKGRSDFTAQFLPSSDLQVYYDILHQLFADILAYEKVESQYFTDIIRAVLGLISLGVTAVDEEEDFLSAIYNIPKSFFKDCWGYCLKTFNVNDKLFEDRLRHRFEHFTRDVVVAMQGYRLSRKQYFNLDDIFNDVNLFKHKEISVKDRKSIDSDFAKISETFNPLFDGLNGFVQKIENILKESAEDSAMSSSSSKQKVLFDNGSSVVSTTRKRSVTGFLTNPLLSPVGRSRRRAASGAEGRAPGALLSSSEPPMQTGGAKFSSVQNMSEQLDALDSLLENVGGKIDEFSDCFLQYTKTVKNIASQLRLYSLHGAALTAMKGGSLQHDFVDIRFVTKGLASKGGDPQKKVRGFIDILQKNLRAYESINALIISVNNRMGYYSDLRAALRACSKVLIDKIDGKVSHAQYVQRYNVYRDMDRNLNDCYPEIIPVYIPEESIASLISQYNQSATKLRDLSVYYQLRNYVVNIRSHLSRLISLDDPSSAGDFWDALIEDISGTVSLFDEEKKQGGLSSDIAVIGNKIYFVLINLWANHSLNFEAYSLQADGLVPAAKLSIQDSYRSSFVGGAYGEYLVSPLHQVLRCTSKDVRISTEIVVLYVAYLQHKAKADELVKNGNIEDDSYKEAWCISAKALNKIIDLCRGVGKQTGKFTRSYTLTGLNDVGVDPKKSPSVNALAQQIFTRRDSVSSAGTQPSEDYSVSEEVESSGSCSP